MATKKQKREAALAKREAYMAEVRADGLKALEEDRKRQAEVRKVWAEVAQEINSRHQAILKSALVMGSRVTK